MLGRYLRRIAQLLERKGYAILPTWQIDRWVLAASLKGVFAGKGIDCVLDVGANRGQFRDFLRHDVGFSGLILSFEPVRRLAEACRSRAETDMAWQIFDTALGNSVGEAKINVLRDDSLTSLLMPLADQPFAADSEIISTEVVSVSTLDTILPKLKREFGFQRAYLKMDTQGFDLKVIDGARASLPSIPALQTELSLVPLYDGMPSWLTVISALKDHHFDVAALVPVNRDKGGRIIEFDGIFVRNT